LSNSHTDASAWPSRLPHLRVDRYSQLLSFQLQYKPTETAKEEAPRDSAGLIAHGFIHNYMLTQAGKLRNMGLDVEQIEPALLKLVHDNCAPPIDDSKVKAMAHSICNFPPGENTDLLLTQQEQTQNQQPNRVDVSNWLSMFRSVEEMEDGPIVMVIDGVLQEGTCFIGANPGDGKTLIGLAFAKSISTGTPLFGLPQYAVTEPRTVIYLIPESRDRAFRKRCEAFGMSKDKMKFMARTISAGVPLELGDPYLLEAVRQTKAVVFLDTASRFMKGSDENAAAQNRQLVNDVIALLAAGAICVVLIHHATKAAKAKQERMTLENMLRGSSDLGAMCDQAYGIRKDMLLYANGAGPMEIDMVNLKDREQVGGLTTLRLAASHKNKGEDFPVSYINETGNLKPINDAETHKRVLKALLALVESDRNIPAKELATKTGLTEYAVKHKLSSIGWHRVQGGPSGASPWHQDNGLPCPFAKEKAAKREKTSRPLKSGVTEVSVN
jgi:AAA domain-containing protein